jgi:hypothetical protein
MKRDNEYRPLITSFYRNNEKTLAELLIELGSQVDGTGQPNLVNVARSRLLDAACRAFGRLRFNPTHPLSIKFMDDIGQAEGAIDDGGPTQEFFILLLHKFQDHGMFEGPDDRNIIIPSWAQAEHWFIFRKMFFM